MCSRRGGRRFSHLEAPRQDAHVDGCAAVAHKTRPRGPGHTPPRPRVRDIWERDFATRFSAKKNINRSGIYEEQREQIETSCVDKYNFEARRSENASKLSER